MFGFGGGAKKKKAKTARERAMVRLMESMEAKVDDTDKSSVELQHFWKIMLRGMQVRILAQVKGKGAPPLPAGTRFRTLVHGMNFASTPLFETNAMTSPKEFGAKASKRWSPNWGCSTRS